MGVVLRARHRELGRLVALKLDYWTGPLAIAEAMSLASAARPRRFARLDHPNIVPVYEVGDGGGRRRPHLPVLRHEAARTQPGRLASRRPIAASEPPAWSPPSPGRSTTPTSAASSIATSSQAQCLARRAAQSARH